MNIQPYIFFESDCAEAMRFYEKALRGKLEMMVTHAEMPDFDATKFPLGTAERIMHARLVVDGQVLMASDNGSGMPYDGMKGFTVTLTYPDVAEGKRVFDALAEGGQVRMPFGKTFWAEAFGMTVDRFGTPWMVNAGLSDPTSPT